MTLHFARRRWPAAAAVAVTFFAVGSQAFAERADKAKAAVIIADRNAADDLNQTQLFTGDVVLTKGTIILRADQLTTRQDPEGYNYGTALATKPGKLAYFKQKREGVDEYIEGQALRIDYDEKADTVKLCGNAVVKRLIAGRDADESRGDCIDYNSRTEVSHNESTAGTAGRRTTTILQPKIKPGTASAETPSVRSPASPPIELRKQPTIEQKVP